MKIAKTLISVLSLISISAFAGGECLNKKENLSELSAPGTQAILNALNNSSSENGNSHGRASDDMRVVKDSSTPRFLDAVGRLSITNANGKRSICSGTLVGEPGQNSRVVNTSAHCFPKGTTKIEWTTTTQSGKVITRTAKILTQDSAEDWAVILLDKPINKSDVAPIQMANLEELGTPVDIYGMEEGELFVAGFSSDKELGKNGSVLTYESSVISFEEEVENEKELEIEEMDYGFYEVNSYVFGGASGGGVIYNWDSDYDGKGDTPILVGTIKGIDSHNTIIHTSGNGVKGGGSVVFTGYDKYAEILNDYTDHYNR